MKQYRRPEYHFVRNVGGLSGDEIAKLSEKELAEYFSRDSMKKEQKKYRIRPGYILREIAGEYAIVPVDPDSIFSNAVMAPNETAVFLWKAFEEPKTIEDIVRIGIDRYNATEEIIRNSTERFIEESLKYEILEEVK